MATLVERIEAISDASVKKLSDRYKSLKEGEILGAGANATVYQSVQLATGTKVAIKAIDATELKDDDYYDALRMEIVALRELKHPHIVKLHEVVSEGNKQVYLVMELLRGEELFKKVIEKGPFDEAYASALFAQIVLAVEHMHQRGLVHRDIKAENIVFASEGSGSAGGGGPPMLKLIDLGGAADANQKAEGLVGTPQYVAPEIITGYGEGGDMKPYDGKACDMWSLGVLLFVMLSKALPFSAREQDKLLKLVVRGTFVFRPKDRWDKISPYAKSLVTGLLQREPGNRLSIAQVKTNPWIDEAIKAAEAQVAKLLAEQEVASAPSAQSNQLPPSSETPRTDSPQTSGRRGSIAKSIIPSWVNGLLSGGSAASGGKKKYQTSLSFAPQAQRAESTSKGLREQNYWYSVHVGGVTVDEDGVQVEGHVPPEVLAELRRMQEEGLLNKGKGGAAAASPSTPTTNPMLKPMSNKRVDVSDGAGSSDAVGGSMELTALREQLAAATSRAERAEAESGAMKEELASVRRSHATAEQEVALLRSQLQGVESENRKLRAELSGKA